MIFSSLARLKWLAVTEISLRTVSYCRDRVGLESPGTESRQGEPAVRHVSSEKEREKEREREGARKER